MDNSQFKIKPGYRSRPACNANLTATDRAQRNVYQFAQCIERNDANVKSVLDWGCGSGQKLVHFFGHLDTLGVDVDYRLPTLQARYLDRQWGIAPVPIDADLVFCADVIEHLEEPGEFLRDLKSGRWRHCIISTPERDRCRGKRDMGPPLNKWHTREWNETEFATFLTAELNIKPTTTVLGEYNLVAHLMRPRASSIVATSSSGIAVGNHWSIDHCSPCVLDMTLREDESRIRKDRGQENFATIRRTALSLLKQDNSKRSTRKNRNRAA